MPCRTIYPNSAGLSLEGALAAGYWIAHVRYLPERNTEFQDRFAQGAVVDRRGELFLYRWNDQEQAAEELRFPVRLHAEITGPALPPPDPLAEELRLLHKEHERNKRAWDNPEIRSRLESLGLENPYADTD